jgi:hypothetical protein
MVVVVFKFVPSIIVVWEGVLCRPKILNIRESSHTNVV